MPLELFKQPNPAVDVEGEDKLGQPGEITAGPGEVDQYAVEDWISPAKPQPTQKLYKFFRITDVTGLSGAGATATRQIDAPQTPEFWVINVWCMSQDANQAVARVGIDQGVDSNPNASETAVYISGAGRIVSFRRVVLRGRNDTLKFFFERLSLSSGLNIDFDISVWAITGYEPDNVGCF